MLAHRAASLLGLAACAAVALPATAAAAPVTLNATVVGAPYPGGATRTAVPVLLSGRSARAAELLSPLGMLVVPRQGTVATPEGPVRPGNLRAPR